MPRLLPALPLAILLAGCGASTPPAVLGPEADFIRAEAYFEDGRYLQAAEAFDAFRLEHPGSDRVDDAIFLLGKSHQKLGENLLAREEFDRLLRDFPQTAHREAAYFERAMSWMDDSRRPALDPEPTEQALEAFEGYLRTFPDGQHVEEARANARLCRDKLATKAFLNGQLYLKLKHPGAARLYFEKSVEILSDSGKAGEALWGIVRSWEMEGKYDEAIEANRRVLEYATPERVAADPDLAEIRRQAEASLARLGAGAAGGG